jgi:hypothetical protein
VSLPPGARRLFSGYDVLPCDPVADRSLILARLLEDGDGADLAWLTSLIPEAEIAGWLARHGGRQLSCRSRAFWSVVLGTAPGASAEAADLLWPL